MGWMVGAFLYDRLSGRYMSVQRALWQVRFYVKLCGRCISVRRALWQTQSLEAQQPRAPEREPRLQGLEAARAAPRGGASLARDRAQAPPPRPSDAPLGRRAPEARPLC